MMEDQFKGHTMTLDEKTPPSKSIYSHVRDFCDYTTTHGFSRLAVARDRGGLWHIFWIIMLIGAHSLFYYNTYLILKDYWARPIRTKVTMKHGKNMVFPTVTLCNHNILRKKMVPLSLINEISKITNTTATKKSSTNKTRKTASQTFIANPEFKHSTQVEWELFRNAYYKYDKDSLKEYGHQLQDMVLDCNFNGEDCSPQYDEAFTWRHVWLDDVGNCYMFNRALNDNGDDVEAYKSSLAGDKNGLKLTLNAEQFEYLDGISPYAGLTAVIATQGHMPFPRSNGIDLAPGFATSIELRRNFITRLDPFKNDSCESSNEFEITNVFQRYNVTYSQMTCKISCLASMQVGRCKCTMFLFSLEKDYGFCDFTNTSVSDCLSEVYEQFLDGRCDANCPPPCKEAYFSTTISSSKWPSNSYKKRLNETLKRQRPAGMTDDEIKDNLIELHIYYADLDYVHVEETLKYEFQDIISNIGGQLGMWIGVSALSIAEVIELFIIIVNFLINNKKKRQTITVND